uniref:NADH dehydrogenase [ubiquinone] 1 beta subcomplex subunit 4 n=1 Tax=Eptatretus burgeri TaxID=7764 RepID=A0A8C4PY67_EPTBU
MVSVKKSQGGVWHRVLLLLFNGPRCANCYSLYHMIPQHAGFKWYFSRTINMRRVFVPVPGTSLLGPQFGLGPFFIYIYTSKGARLRRASLATHGKRQIA